MLRRNRLFLLSFLLLTILLLCWATAGCGRQGEEPTDPEYENQKIIIGGDIGEPQEISVGEMRTLPQEKIDASFYRTTGLLEEFTGAGPTLSNVLAYLGITYDDYKGIAVTGRDGYYCLMTPEIVSDRQLVLALSVDGRSRLTEELRPARLCVKDELGPYWVKMVERIDLYEEVSEQNITSVWVFKNLTEGLEPYKYEYYGSKDDAIELAQIFSRFDQVSTKTFFTMMSSDGFKKQESLNVVSSRYYIKIGGEDAPMNMSPEIKLGMNVKHIAWFSTNEDAVFFPEEIVKLTGEEQIGSRQGIPLPALLAEVQVENIAEKQFELIGVDGESCRVSGGDLAQGILLIEEEGVYPVFWAEETGLSPIGNLLRVRSLAG